MQLDLHGRNIPITPSLLELASRRLEYALGRFAHAIGRVSLRLEDINGPRGGLDTTCLAVVELKPRGSLVVHSLSTNPSQAVHEVIDRLARTVQRRRGYLIDRAHGG